MCSGKWDYPDGMKKKLIVLTGAGMSAESGLKTFRDSDGLWEGYDIQEVATPGGWKKNPGLVLEFYNMRRQDITHALPNAAHEGLAALEAKFDVRIITQNIDDLHERAGSTNVLHLHGEIFKMRSEWDETLIYPIEKDIKLGDRAQDGAQLRPYIVWFEEPVPLLEEASRLVRQAEIFVVIGTSLAVYPAAGLIHFAGAGIPKFIIDKRPPSLGDVANLSRIPLPATEGILLLQESLHQYI
jgi:NAD-dependent deacetylase